MAYIDGWFIDKQKGCGLKYDITEMIAKERVDEQSKLFNKFDLKFDVVIVY